MLYFSEIKGRKVYNERNIEIGTLEDLVFIVNGTPKISKLIIKDPNGIKTIISSFYLIQDENTYLNNPVLLKNDYQTTQIEENELYVRKNLLDKQIIDLVGHKVVRVNDVALQDKGELYIAGVDISFLGILRWIKIAEFVIKVYKMFHINLQPKLLSWTDIQPLELARGKVKLKKEEKKLQRVKPEDLADYLETTNVANTARIIRLLDDEKAAEVLGNLNINFRTSIFQNFKPETSAKWLSFLEPDQAVDVLLSLSKIKQDQILSLIPEDKKVELLHLLNLAAISPIGNLMTNKFVTVNSTNTVREVVDKIKKHTFGFASLNYVYVINEKEELIGVFNLHELLLQKPDTQAYKFMLQNLVVIYLNTPVEIAVKRMLKYKLDGLPVVDKNRKLLGTVLLDDVTDIVTQYL